MVWIVLGVVGWVGCGVLTRGLLLAFFQGRYRLIADEVYDEDVRYATFAGLCGPLGLAATLLGGFYGYGWRWK